MNAVPSERKSWGPLIATIDLLFLVLAFFTLLLFFVQKEREQARVKLERVEGSLAAALPEGIVSPEARGNAMVELVERLMAIQKVEQDRQAKLERQEERRQMRRTVRINYEVLPGGRIVYEGRTYSPSEFRSQVVAPLRRSNWLAFRAYAAAETPFGEVVATRRQLLENGAEFDTYWDNLTDSGASPGQNR
jgi:hypothetical protein